MTTRDRTTEKYLDELLYQLRMRGVPGARIGDILAEVEAHVAESGETAQAAFGEPREYARGWDGPGRPWPGWITGRWAIVVLVAAMFGINIVIALGAAAFEIDISLLYTATVVVASILLAHTVIGIVRRPVDQVTDPRDGTSRTLGRRGLLMVIVGMWALMITAYVVLSLWSP